MSAKRVQPVILYDLSHVCIAVLMSMRGFVQVLHDDLKEALEAYASALASALQQLPKEEGAQWMGGIESNKASYNAKHS